jgi:nucleotide-binding universal stress UspA family protein
MVTARSNVGPVVVVGFDGSRHLLDALRWAASYARGFRALLRPVAAWSFSGSAEYVVHPDFERVARDNLELALQVLRREFRDVAVEPAVVHGSAASVLIATSRDADLLVVGSRGDGGFSGMLLGSVSRHYFHHAACPVVVVRGGLEMKTFAEDASV